MKKQCPICDQPWRGKTCKVCGFVRPEPPKKEREKRTEAQIVRAYANSIVSCEHSRGKIKGKFYETRPTKMNKDVWQDEDFYFSVVFQSSDQKNEFLAFLSEKFNIEANDDGRSMIQIVNGLILAKNMGLELKKEVAGEYPCGNIELKDFILDEEKI